MKLCNFCQTKAVRLVFKANKKNFKKTPEAFVCTNCGFGNHGPIVKCQFCGIVYVDEKISQNQISTYYEVAEDLLYFKEQNARKKTFSNYLSKLEKTFPKKGKLLDIGTNTGLFVRLALDRGWDAVGLEPNKWAVQYAQKNYEVKLINQPFEKNTFPQNSFEVITMWDVIEHFTDPIAEMKKVYGQLKPGGLFAFSTVDPASFLAKKWGTNWSWYMDMHRVFLTRPTAEYYLQKTGFGKIIFSPHWRFLSLGYLSSRLIAVNYFLANTTSRLIEILGLTKTIIPYYANDLYDCYAFK